MYIDSLFVCVCKLANCVTNEPHKYFCSWNNSNFSAWNILCCHVKWIKIHIANICIFVQVIDPYNSNVKIGKQNIDLYHHSFAILILSIIVIIVTLSNCPISLNKNQERTKIQIQTFMHTHFNNKILDAHENAWLCMICHFVNALIMWIYVSLNSQCSGLLQFVKVTQNIHCL